MKLKTSAFVRFNSYVIGTGFTVANILIITSNLDLFQFAVWGVANSLIYIFSQIGQLTYVQYIEKYFPNLSQSKMNYHLFKFFKTVIVITPLWYVVLLIMDALGYFEKYNADNLFILFMIISFSSVVESLVEIISKYFLSIKHSVKFDLNELLIFKIFRFAVFYLLLTNGFGIYQILLSNFLIRSTFLIRLFLYLDKNLYSVFKKILFSKIRTKNLLNLKYTFSAFIIKTQLVTLLNSLFFIHTIFADNITIANYSLGILIINNLRPIFSSLSALLFPIISQDIKNKQDNNIMFSLVTRINTLLIGVILLISYFVSKYKFILDIFLKDFDSEIYGIILFSVFCSSISTLYLPQYFDRLFSDNENNLLLFITLNYFINLSLYLFSTKFEVLNFLIFYLLFEFCNLLYFYFNFYSNNKLNLFKNFSVSYLIVSCYILINIYEKFNINYLYAVVIVFFAFLLFDSKKTFEKYRIYKEIYNA
ncbi:MAG: hypothetical protein CMQ83_01175 [Gammaproteobacteria bacterium]|nr:hypothetical protein [Gammaproteobacteria bacterium]|tara:strand:+ start:1076 stop:2509 length:1434 start_codon:yes stop_codon:yes gene_type:complete